MAQNKKVGIWQTLSRTYDKGVGWSDNYPHGGPNEYSYTTGFYEYRPTTGKKAINNLVQPALAFSNVIANPALMTNLDAIIAQARKSELQYLNNHEFKVGTYADWSDLVIGVNEILSTSEIFERNIQLLKQYVDTTNTRTKDYRDVFSLFGDYIKTAAGKIIPTIKGRILDMTANDFDTLNKEKGVYEIEFKDTNSREVEFQISGQLINKCRGEWVCELSDKEIEENIPKDYKDNKK